MITQLKDRLTQSQLNQIVRIIHKRYHEHLRVQQSKQYQDLYGGEYSSHRERECADSAILHGFPSKTTNIDGLSVRCIRYGAYRQPEFYNERIVFHILFNTSTFDAKYLEKYYEMNANGFSDERLYCYIKVIIKSREMEIYLCLPDENGEVVDDQLLFQEKVSNVITIGA